MIKHIYVCLSPPSDACVCLVDTSWQPCSIVCPHNRLASFWHFAGTISMTCCSPGKNRTENRTCLKSLARSVHMGRAHTCQHMWGNSFPNFAQFAIVACISFGRGWYADHTKCRQDKISRTKQKSLLTTRLNTHTLTYICTYNADMFKGKSIL